jgi:hypothetical protein
MTMSTQRAAFESTVRSALQQAGVSFEEVLLIGYRTFTVTLAGVQRLHIAIAMSVGDSALTVNAFVARHPDENEAAVHRWLLERNRRLYGVAFAIDQLGDIYLTGKMPREAVNDEEIDRLLGSVLEYVDGSFNTILELGFATSIRREWQWRTERGLSTENLSAFTHLTERPASE